MSIELTITKTPENIGDLNRRRVLPDAGGTLGRGAGCTWVLDDPHRFISSKHAEIKGIDGQYYLLDLSTNGTFRNGSVDPIGNGNRVLLKDGDHFALGDYEFQVAIHSGAAVGEAHTDPFGASFALTSGHSGDFNNAHVAGQDDPFGTPFGHEMHMVEPLLFAGPQETDPLVAMDKAHKFSSPVPPTNSLYGGTQPDNVNPLKQAVSWPSAIPDDWNVEDNARSAPAALQRSPDASIRSGTIELLDKLERAEAARRVLEEENVKLLRDVAYLKQQLKSQRDQKPQAAATRLSTSVDRVLLEAMCLDKRTISEQQMQDIALVAGQLVRETMTGLMKVLGFTKKIKEEFRINVTTIQPIENNPLKFSANLDDAMENMFFKQSKAYQEPVAAVRESFQGVAEHQIAVLAGIQAAFKGMVERFDPDALERRFDKYRKGGLVKVGQKGKNWDAYKEFHAELTNNMDNSFQHLFGYDFVQAYEDQLQKLLVARKSRQ